MRHWQLPQLDSRLQAWFRRGSGDDGMTSVGGDRGTLVDDAMAR